MTYFQVDDEDEACGGAGVCDDECCAERQPYLLEFTRTVKVTVLAHTAEEAEEVAGELASTENPRAAVDDDAVDDGWEWTVQSWLERDLEQDRWRREAARIEADLQAGKAAGQ